MSNPIFNENYGEQSQILDGQPCTVQGTANKTILLLCVLVASFFVTFRMCMLNNADTATVIGTVGAIVGFVFAMIICFKQNLAPVLSPVYAFCEGLFLGAISFFFETQYPGIVFQAVSLTFACLFAMLVLYKTNVIKVTDKFRSTIFIATLGIAIIYLISWILSLFHVSVPAIYSSSMLGIGFSLIVCAIASFNFLLDFDFIDRASANFLPKYFEWYGAFGLMITLVWVYIEILRLLAKLNRR